MKVLHLIGGGDEGGAKSHVLSLVQQLGNHISVKLKCAPGDGSVAHVSTTCYKPSQQNLSGYLREFQFRRRERPSR